MKEIKQTPKTEQADGAAPFKGYTMEEIKYHRAMMALRKEFCKAKLMQSIEDMRPKRKSKDSSKSRFSLAASIASKIFSNLNTLDYIMLGMSLFGTVRKGVKLLRGRKK